MIIFLSKKVGEHNTEFEKLSASMNDIHLRDHHVPMQAVDIRKLLPGTRYLTFEETSKNLNFV
jgi:hypothetical protein